MAYFFKTKKIKIFFTSSKIQANMQLVSSAKVHHGHQNVYQHASETLGCDMKFAVFLPSKTDTTACPVLFYLSGLTCTEQNVITKAGFQRKAEELGIAVVCPDTSPSWSFGGYFFYLFQIYFSWLFYQKNPLLDSET